MQHYLSSLCILREWPSVSLLAGTNLKLVHSPEDKYFIGIYWDLGYWDPLSGRHNTWRLEQIQEENMQNLYSQSTIILVVQTDHKKLNMQVADSCE